MGDLGKLIVVKGFKKLPKSNKSPNLVTLVVDYDGNGKEGRKANIKYANLFVITPSTIYSTNRVSQRTQGYTTRTRRLRERQRESVQQITGTMSLGRR